ncbi:hypothetical protein [Paenibacillus lutimineralis]|nr:hypothetical protein [Paenibacillus lutimineralis]
MKSLKRNACSLTGAGIPLCFGAVKPTMTGERIAGSDEVRGSIPLRFTNT